MNDLMEKPGIDSTPGKAAEGAAARVLFAPIVDDFWKTELPNLRKLSQQTATDLINERLGHLPAQRVDLFKGDMLISSLPRQHFLFPAILRLLNAHDRFGTPLNVALVGPPGTGKTRMCLNAAEALATGFVLQPFNPQTTKSELLGYMDANGRYVESSFYKAFKNGLLFVADEFDAANPAVATVLNAAVSNRVLTFPNGETVHGHKDFRALYCMNTYGQGSDDRYTGRTRLDMATLDRLVYVFVPIDPGLEAALIGVPDVASPSCDLEKGGRFDDERAILHRVISVRGVVEKEHLRYSISPRTTIHACALHDAGFGREWIEECCIWRGMPDSERQRVRKLAA